MFLNVMDFSRLLVNFHADDNLLDFTNFGSLLTVKNVLKVTRFSIDFIQFEGFPSIDCVRKQAEKSRNEGRMMKDELRMMKDE